jgi:hypothetical protein
MSPPTSVGDTWLSFCKRWLLLICAGIIAVLNIEVNGHTWKEILLSTAIVAMVAAVKIKFGPNKKE